MEKTSLLAPRSSPISVANKQDKQHYPITIDLVATELLSKLFLNLRSALLSQLHILRCAVFQMLLLLLRQFAYKPRGVTGPQLHLTRISLPTSPEGISCCFSTTEPAPTMEYEPTWQPSSSTAPMPMREKSSTWQAFRIAP